MFLQGPSLHLVAILLLILHSAQAFSYYVNVTANSTITPSLMPSNCYNGSPYCTIFDAIENCKASYTNNNFDVCELSLRASTFALHSEIFVPEMPFRWVIRGMNPSPSEIMKAANTSVGHRIIFNNGNLTLVNVRISRGYFLYSIFGHDGAGINNMLDLVIINSIIEKNENILGTADCSVRAIAQYGGGIWNGPIARIVLNDVKFIGNKVTGGCCGGCHGSIISGGAIYNSVGGDISGCSVWFIGNGANNHDAMGHGGAI